MVFFFGSPLCLLKKATPKEHQKGKKCTGDSNPNDLRLTNRSCNEILDLHLHHHSFFLSEQKMLWMWMEWNEQTLGVAVVLELDFRFQPKGRRLQFSLNKIRTCCLCVCDVVWWWFIVSLCKIRPLQRPTKQNSIALASFCFYCRIITIF